MAFVKRHPEKSRMEGPLSRNHTKYCRKCLQLGTLLSLVRNILMPEEFLAQIHILKVTTCSKSAFRAGTLQNNYQRLNTSYVLLKRVRTAQIKKWTSIYSDATISFFLQVLWLPLSPTLCGSFECECSRRNLILRLLIVVYGVRLVLIRLSLAILALISIVDGLSTIVRQEGPFGLLRGTSLALFGVSSGAIQFMVYEKMKAWGFERKRKQYAREGKVYDAGADKLVRCTFVPIH